jgi:ribonuclease P protein component
MNRRYRLKGSSDFRRVRRTGKSYAHPLAVLIAAPSDAPTTRLGVAAAKAVGRAVERNRAKRRLRAALQYHLPRIRPGWDAIFYARKALLEAEWPQVLAVTEQLLRRAGMLNDAESTNRKPQRPSGN